MANNQNLGKLLTNGGTISGTLSATSINGVTALSSTSPSNIGTAAVGTSTTVARADHVHDLPASGVTASTYGSSTNIPQIAVDAKGRITSASNVAVSIPSGSISVTGGDITMSGSTGTAITNATLANSGVTAGTYTKVTVDAKGRATSGTTLSSADLPTYTGTITSSQVTTGLGFTPYNSTNPSGYITSSGSISGNAATATTATTANALNSANAYTGTSFNSITALSSTTPVMDGTAAVGTSTTVARADHVHGSDTSKLSLTGGTMTGEMIIPNITISRESTPASGLSWYNTTFNAWVNYMGAAGTSGLGPNGAITAPTGSLVTSWGKRDFIENLSGYGWTFESGASNATAPSIVAEIRASDGAAKFNGTVTTPSIVSTPQSSAPASPVNGQIYYDSNDMILKVWTGSAWSKYLKDGTDFLYRQIITTSFVMGGYQNSSPWKNVNRMVHSTNVCTNLGDLLSYSASYSNGAGGKRKGWMFSAANAHATATTQVCAFDMVTETNIAANSANFMRGSRNDSGVAWKETDFCYILGGGPSTTMDIFNFTTETCATANSAASILADGTGPGVVAMVDEKHALMYNDGGGQILIFATDTNMEYTVGSAYGFGANAQQKPISSKLNKGYSGNEGTYNGGYNYRRWVMNTATQNSTVAKPVGNIGEENYDMGQDHQYMLGNYDGSQNNRGHRFTYATDSGYELGSGSIRTGVPGGSSGGTCWRA